MNHRLIAALLISVPLVVQGACKSESPEHFGEFFTKFSKAKNFAQSRTIYPTYTLRHEYGLENGKPTTSTTKTVVSKSMDASTATISELEKQNSMHATIKFAKNRKATVELAKPDSDWVLTYHFTQRDGCWFLHHVEDHSL